MPELTPQSAPRLLAEVFKANSGLLLFVVLMFAFRSAFADWNDVPTGSMVPTILPGDRVLVNRMAYDLRVPFTQRSLHRRAEPKAGDIVVFDSKIADKRLLKRVVGVPGDRIALENNELIINGHRVSYGPARLQGEALERIEYLPEATHRIRLRGTSGDFGPVTVPADHLLVLGDNRDNSADSRVIGFVPRKEILGRATHVVLSLDYDHSLLPRSDRFWLPLG